MMGTQRNHHHSSITCVLLLLLLVIGLFLSCDAFSYPASSRRARLSSSSATQRIASFNLQSTATNFTESTSTSIGNNIWLKEGDNDELLPLIAMPDSTSDKSVMVASLFGAIALVCCIKISNLFTLSTIFQSFVADPVGTISSIGGGTSSSLSSMVYFSLFYVIAELIAIPATPLTLSAGYLFGVTNGTILVLLSGVISAIVGFSIGRIFLREKVEGVLDDKPIFRKLDKVTSSDGGLKMLILARLTPIFPFCLLNYFYGVSSISFLTFVLGTTVGFVPTTLLYTYTGLVGKEVVLGSGSGPWYMSVCAVIALMGGLKLVTDVVTNLIEAVEEE